MKYLILLALALGSGYNFTLVAQESPATSASEKKMNAFISELMRKMTLEEKVGQLNLPSVGFDVTGPVVSQDVEAKIKKGLVGGVFNTFTPIAVRKLQELAVKETRLKIPLLFGYDVIHGHRTIFPISLGLAASWDLDLIERTARAAAEEATADGLNWAFSPMVDITRDPRWGRVSEGAGEDPYLGAAIAKAMVKGYQGDDLSKNNTIMACVKHFALYGASEAGRDYNTVDMSRVRMYNEYLAPYKAAIEAGVGSVMTSFNDVEGVPASGNKWLMDDLLRKQWGFKGLIVTDYTAVNEMIAHGMGDGKKVAELTLNASVDMDMVGELVVTNGAELVRTGRVKQSVIDAACRRVLEAKYKLGLFDNPYHYVSEERNKAEIMNAEKLALSREAAIKSMVLLKNANNTLPLRKEQKIAFIGPLVKNQRDLIGSWSGAGDWKKAISLWMGLASRLDTNRILYAKGANLIDDTMILNKINPHDAQIVLDAKPPAQLLEEAVQVASQAELIVAVLGEAFGMTGEAASRSMIGLPENQLELLKALHKTGKPIVLVLMNGRPLTLQWEEDNMAAILEAWYGGTNAGPAIADLLFGDANPSGRLTMSFPRNVGQIPIFYNAKTTGRPFDPNQKYTTKYLDVPNTALYPFGYGLSYTSFSYGEIELDRKAISAKDKLQVSINITNSGNYDGTETVQLYLRDLVATITRPGKELKKFQKVELKKGESKLVQFEISIEDLKYYDKDMKRIVEPGEFHVLVGPNSRDLKQVSFTLTP